jgi:hypothetical protein
VIDEFGFVCLKLHGVVEFKMGNGAPGSREAVEIPTLRVSLVRLEATRYQGEHVLQIGRLPRCLRDVGNIT